MESTTAMSDAIVMVNPAPLLRRDGSDAVRFLAVTAAGEWLRLDAEITEETGHLRKLNRWNKIRFGWQPAEHDLRVESRRVDAESLRVTGELPHGKRHDFLTRLEVTSLEALGEQGKTLALLKPAEPSLVIERKNERELAEEQRDPARPKPSPYRFKYRYKTDDGEQAEIYRGAEIDATFAKLVGNLGEAATLAWIIKVFGRDYLQKGANFAMSRDPRSGRWDLQGIIGLGELYEVAGNRFNVVC